MEDQESAGAPLWTGVVARVLRMVPAPRIRATSASRQTPTVRLAAPTHAPARSVKVASARAVPAIAASRKTVPIATWRVFPEMIITPWMKRR